MPQRASPSHVMPFATLAVLAAVAIRPARLASGGQGPATAPTLEVGEPVPVSGAGRAFVEPYVAVDPTGPDRLVVSVSQIDPAHGVVPRVFTSDDGGRTWRSPSLGATAAAVTSGRLGDIEDMWVEVGTRGTMYLSMLVVNPPGTHESDPWGKSPVLVVRSDDHGAHWSRPAALRTRSADAPKLAVQGDSVVVVAVEVSAGDTTARVPRDGTEYIAVYRSTNGARTFAPPRFLVYDDLGHAPLNPIFLPDGTLLVAWMDHPHYGRQGPEQHLGSSRIEVVRSGAGDTGGTFSLPQVIADVPRAGFPADLRMIADESPASPYRGRVYVIWNGGTGGHSDLSLATSDDGGQRWSFARHLTAGDGADVFTAAATAPDGTLALLWAHHQHDAKTTPCYGLRMTVSTDGGESFAAPVALTTMPICPDAAGNKAIAYPTYGRVDTVSTAWRHGGDYIGLAAGADGVFHPVWTDTRDGPFRVYTARVRVRR